MKTQIAVHTLMIVFEGGDTTVIDRHVRPDCIRHNPLVPADPRP